MVKIILYCEPAIIRGGLSLLINAIPEAEVVTVAGSITELDPSTPLDATWVVYQHDPAVLERLSPYIHDSQSLLLLRDEGQTVGLNPRDLVTVWGLVSTGISPETFRAAILGVAQRMIVIDTRFTPGQESLFTSLFQTEELSEPLTDREMMVLRKIAEGLTNKKIALELGISENTVKFHISALFSKINASSRTDAVRRGARLGLLAL